VLAKARSARQGIGHADSGIAVVGSPNSIVDQRCDSAVAAAITTPGRRFPNCTTWEPPALTCTEQTMMKPPSILLLLLEYRYSILLMVTIQQIVQLPNRCYRTLTPPLFVTKLVQSSRAADFLRSFQIWPSSFKSTASVVLENKSGITRESKVDHWGNPSS
jgi:hypothetical protein